MQRVGVVGLGLLGSAIGARLAGAGFQVSGFDVDPAKRSAFAAGGATADASLASLARRADALVLAVFDAAQVESVVAALLAERPAGGAVAVSSSPDAATARAAPVICTSTCPPAPLERLFAQCAAAGMPFIECPVSGTSLQVRNGDALGLLGGDEADIATVRPVVEAFCPRWRRVGPVGAGAKTKLAVNLVLGLNRAALAEGLSFGRTLGLDAADLLAVLKESAAASQVMEVKGAMMASRSFHAPQSRVDQSLKDFKLMQAEALAAGRTLPFAAQYIRLLEQLVAAGQGAIDNAAIIEAIDQC